MFCCSSRLLYAEIKVDWREESEPVSYMSPHAAIRSETMSKQRKLSEEEERKT